MDYTSIKLSPGKKDEELTYEEFKFYGNNFNMNWFYELNIEPEVIIDVGSYDFGDSIRYKKEFPNYAECMAARKEWEQKKMVAICSSKPEPAK